MKLNLNLTLAAAVLALANLANAGDVTGATNQAHGHYAVVALTLKSPRVVAAAIVDQLPTRFRHFR